MNIFEKFIHFFAGTMTTPINFGVWHLISIAFVISTTIFICCTFKNCSDKTFRRIILVFWIVMLVLEVYKQVLFSYELNGKVGVWDFRWEFFPFQLCSMPLYVLPFVAFLKEGKVRDSIMSFMATFAFFGGVAVMIYPGNVFVEYIGINIQTMVHHGLQVVLGVFIFIYNRKKFNHKYFLLGIIPFVAVLLIAIFSNLIMYRVLDEYFNMFYISPYFECHLPVLEVVQQKVPYFAFLLIYILGFVFVAYLMFIIMRGIYNLILFLWNKKNEQKN